MKKFFAFLPLFFFATPLFGAEEETARQGSFYQTLIMIAIAIVFFYFILWRPEKKRRKAMEEKRGSMKKGDKVTAMGIIGVVDRIQEQTVIVRMFDGAKVEFIKAAITEVHPEGEPATEQA